MSGITEDALDGRVFDEERQIWNAYQSLDGIIEMSYKGFVKLIKSLKTKEVKNELNIEKIK